MKKLLFGMALATVANVAMAADAKLTGIEITKVSNGVEIQINGEELGTPKPITAWGGKSYMLEFSAKLVGKAVKEDVDAFGVDYVRAVWFSAKPAKVRVQVIKDPTSDATFAPSGSGWKLKITTATPISAQEPVRTQPRMTETQKAFQAATELLSAPFAKLEPQTSKKTDVNAVDTKDAQKSATSVSEIKSPIAIFTASNAAIAALPALDGDVDAVYGKKTKDQPKVGDKVTVKRSIPSFTSVHNGPTISASSGQGIDFEFVNTDVVQVLRAIAMQADVNIVTAPDVKGQVTVALHDVSVNDALNLVTALCGLSYAKVNHTFVVASDPSLLRKFGQVDSTATTQVVPIYSGEGTMIKTAVLKSLPINGSGNFEIVLPSEDLSISSTTQVEDPNAKPAGEGDKNGKQDEGTAIKTETSRNSKVKDTYVMLIGPAARLVEVARAVRVIDEQLCAAHGIDIPSNTAMVRKSFLPKGTKVGFLLMAVSGQTAGNPSFARVGTVEMYATPVTSIGEQVITLYGRENEVDKLIENLTALDQVGGAEEFTVYDVKFLDPRGIKQDVENQFPGVQCSLTPATAGAPGLFREQTKQQTATGSSQSSEQKSDSTSGSAEVKTDSGSLKDGITLPFSELEKQAYSMRVMLRGSRNNIRKAMQYLAAVDVQPRQLALELRVMDLSREEGLRVGIDWGALTSGGVSIFRVNQGLDSPGTGGVASTGAQLAGGKSLSIAATLDQIANNRNLIARPNLFAYDGRQAELFVGDIIRYIESIQSTQNGITVTSKELPVGVRLAVLPRIGGDGQVTMDLRPVVSTLNGFTNVPGGGQLPQTSLRIAQNTLTMTDGETIAIGGLIQDNDIKRVSGIPILKDLPFIGKLLFSRTDNSRKRTELVFFLTVHVVNKDNRGNMANPSGHDPSSPNGG